jgi:hypothetical protein
MKKKALAIYANAFVEKLDRLSAAALSAVTPAAAVSSSATTTGRTRFSRARFIDRQGTAFQGLAVDFRDCLLSILIRTHCDKSEAARFSGELVLHQHYFLDCARLGKKLLQFVFGRVEGKIPDI